MKNLFSTLFLLSLSCGLFGQSLVAPDTLLAQNFQEDPSNDMLPFPSGDDVDWVNYNKDGFVSTCTEIWGVTPGGWYWESDLGTNDPTDNSAFTSCSYNGTFPFGYQNRNWLITPPVFIADSSYYLAWKSLAIQGPWFLDGYHVLVSTNSNDIGDFTDILFSAAQYVTYTTDSFDASLDLLDYEFSPGYIQANSFTDTNYYFMDLTLDPNNELKPYFHGRFEPHFASLSAYVNQTIYIAFLHDSDNDYILQVDDIAVTKVPIIGVGTNQPDSGVLEFSVQPNPVRDFMQAAWTLKQPQDVRLDLLDVAGTVVWKQNFRASPATLDLSGQAPGVYFLRLQTAGGQTVQRFVKL